MDLTLDQHRYLERINYHDELSVSLDCLRALHRHHVMAVPFEATDIHFGHEIKLDLDHIYDKVIKRQRGGFCYELNYLFSTLLRQLGFSTIIISAEVNNEGIYGPPFDHLSVVVDLDGPWLLDVGFGDLFMEPIQIRTDLIQPDRDNDYLLQATGPETFRLLASRHGEHDFTPKYRFKLTPRKIEDFAEQCRFKQTSPASHFVQNFICTLPTEEGRKTVKNGVFKVRQGGGVEERVINDEAELKEVLAEHFGLG